MRRLLVFEDIRQSLQQVKFTSCFHIHLIHPIQHPVTMVCSLILKIRSVTKDLRARKTVLVLGLDILRSLTFCFIKDLELNQSTDMKDAFAFLETRLRNKTNKKSKQFFYFSARKFSAHPRKYINLLILRKNHLNLSHASFSSNESRP